MLNRVVIVGRLTRDPELRKTANDTSVASFTVACDNRMKGPDGERGTTFIPCVVWNQQADNVVKFVRKGSLVACDGRLQQRSFDRKDGTKATVLEVICDSVQFLEPKGSNSRVEDLPGENVSQVEPITESKNLDGIDLTDDDVPF